MMSMRGSSSPFDLSGVSATGRAGSDSVTRAGAGRLSLIQRHHGGARPLDRRRAALLRGLPDPRTGDNGSYAMADFGLAAFSVFFAQSPSFLAHQRQLAAGHGRSHAPTLFGMSRIPGDSHIRRMLDPVAPDHLLPVFDEVIGDLERSGGLAAFQRLGSRVLIALDGTEYHRSTKIYCPHCSTRTRAGQPTEHFHTLLAATIVAPGHQHAVPLAPEFIVPQDGHDKQDCESRAVRRWLARHGPGLARLDPVILATTSMPASRCARRCWRRAGTSCSP